MQTNRNNFIVLLIKNSMAVYLYVIQTNLNELSIP